MSVPHTGKLIAEIDGQRCEFNGDDWTTPVVALTSLLNQVTDTTPKTHLDIRSLALQVLLRTGLQDRATIRDWNPDQWTEDIPPDATD